MLSHLKKIRWWVVEVNIDTGQLARLTGYDPESLWGRSYQGLTDNSLLHRSRWSPCVCISISNHKARCKCSEERLPTWYFPHSWKQPVLFDSVCFATNLLLSVFGLQASQDHVQNVRRGDYCWKDTSVIPGNLPLNFHFYKDCCVLSPNYAMYVAFDFKDS